MPPINDTAPDYDPHDLSVVAAEFSKAVAEEQLARHGELDGAEGDAAGGEPATEPQAETQAQPKPEKKPVAKPEDTKPEATEGADPNAEKRAQLEAMAKELGLKLEGGRVTSVERAKFREERREILRRVEQERQELARQRAEIEQAGQALRQASQALEAGDFDSFAKALGRQDWNELNKEVLAAYNDPNFKRLRELEKRERERQEAEQRRQQEAEARQRAEQREREMLAYKAELSKQMSSSENRVVQALADDPRFVEAVFRVQKHHWDPVARQTVTPEEALELMVGDKNLLTDLRDLYSRLRNAFGDEGEPSSPGAQNSESVPRAPKARSQSPATERAAKPRTSIPQRQASEAAPPEDISPDDPRWLNYWAKRMERSSRDEAD